MGGNCLFIESMPFNKSLSHLASVHVVSSAMILYFMARLPIIVCFEDRHDMTAPPKRSTYRVIDLTSFESLIQFASIKPSITT